MANTYQGWSLVPAKADVAGWTLTPAAAPVAEPPSTGEAIGRASVQGATAGFGDELNALVQAMPDAARWLNPAGFVTGPLKPLAEAFSDTPASQREAAAEVDAERDAKLSFGDKLRRAVESYRQNRDTDRAGNKAAKVAHPWAYGVTNFVSGIPLALAAPGGQAKGIGQMAAAGALQGGVSGAGGSEADLTKGDLGGFAFDTGIGAGAGAALGAGLGLLGRALKPAMSRGAELLERLGITQGRKVLTGGTKSISQAAAVSDPAVERALREGAIKPLGTTAGASERLDVLREAAGQEYAQVVKALEDAGVAGPAKDALVAELRAQAEQEAANTAGSRVPAYFSKIARDVERLPAEARIPGEEVVLRPRPPGSVSTALRPTTSIAEAPRYVRGDMGEIIEAAREAAPLLPYRPSAPQSYVPASEVGEVITGPVDRLRLGQAENVKRSLQDAASKAYKTVGGNTELADAKIAAAARLRQAVEDAIEQQSAKAPDAAAAFIPVKQRSGQLIEAATAAEKALNAAKNKNAISLRDLLVAGAGKDPAQKLALLPFSMVARAVGPSTVAAGSYGAGQALRNLAGKSLSQGTRDVLTAAQRAALASYLESP